MVASADFGNYSNSTTPPFVAPTSAAYVRLVSHCLMILFSLIGLFGNSMIVYATACADNLKSKCNALVALLAGCDLLINVATIQIISGIYLFPIKNQLYCLLSLSYSVQALCMNTFLTFIIGLDRWVCMHWPLKYRNMPKMKYLKIVIAVSTFDGLIVLIAGLLTSSTKVKIYVCSQMPGFTKAVQGLYFGKILFWTIPSVVVYMLAYHCLHKRMRNSNSDENSASLQQKARMLDTLLIVMFFSLGGLILTRLAGFVIANSTPASLVYYIGAHFAGHVQNFNFCFNFFIYFIRSKEYLEAFVKVAPFLNFFTRTSVQVSPQHNNIVPIVL